MVIIFGFGTLYNVRAQKRRIQSMTIRVNHKDRRRVRNDNQLLLILIVHIGCYACFAMPYYVTLIVAVVEPSVITNPVFLFIEHLAFIALNFNQAVG